MFRIATVALASTAALSLAGVSGGIGVGGLPPAGPFVGTPNVAPMVPNWELGSPSDPIGIFPDPGSPFWRKEFVLDVGNAGIQTGDVFRLTEWLEIEPSNFTGGITDWHEEINPNFADGGNWAWEAGNLELFDLDSGSVLPVPGLSTMVSDTGVWFFFDAITPDMLPLTLKVEKLLVWNGPDVPISSTPLTFEVHEYFTPAPGAAALLGLGGIVAARRRRA